MITNIRFGHCKRDPEFGFHQVSTKERARDPEGCERVKGEMEQARKR
jgi:hypothetical protein